jgi:hypothetical protein
MLPQNHYWTGLDCKKSVVNTSPGISNEKSLGEKGCREVWMVTGCGGKK